MYLCANIYEYILCIHAHMCVIGINILNINKCIIYVICLYTYVYILYLLLYIIFLCLFSNVLTISLTVISFSLLCYSVTILIVLLSLLPLYWHSLSCRLQLFIDFCLLMILFLLLLLWLLPAIHWKSTLGDMTPSPFLYLLVTQWLSASCVLAVMLTAVPILFLFLFLILDFFFIVVS